MSEKIKAIAIYGSRRLTPENTREFFGYLDYCCDGLPNGTLLYDQSAIDTLRAQLADAEEALTVAYMSGQGAGRKQAEKKLARSAQEKTICPKHDTGGGPCYCHKPAPASSEPVGEVTASAVHLEESGLYRHEFLSAERIPVQAELYIAPQLVPEDQWQKLFNQVALILKCLPSAFVDDNAHVIKAAERLMQPAPTSLEPVVNYAKQNIELEQTGWPLIELGYGLVEVGEGHHEHKPALIFGRNGTGNIGEPTPPNRHLTHEETLAVITFTNVESIDVVLMKLGELRDKMTNNTTPQPAPDVQAALLETRIHQFDKSITRIARHVGACCGGVDTEDDNGLGSHTDQEIIRKIDAKVNAAVAAALDKAEAVAVTFGKGRLTGSLRVDGGKEVAQVILQELRAIPRDTSSLDEYKADIKRLVEAVEILTDGSFADSMQLMTKNGRKWLAKIKAKYNL